MAEFSPELNEQQTQAILRRLREQADQARARGTGAAISRGLTGGTFEAAQLGRAEQGYQNASADALVNLAVENASRMREERLILEDRQAREAEAQRGRLFQTEEAEKGRVFTGGQSDIDRQQQLRLFSEGNVFQQGRDLFNRDVTMKMDQTRLADQRQRELEARMFQERQDAVNREFTSSQNRRQRRNELITSGLDAAASNIGTAISLGMFCFLENTKVDMADGTIKSIQNIHVGDILRRGGRVVSSSVSLTPRDTVYRYSGLVYVTGSHAVKEDGKWLRVVNSRLAVPIYNADDTKVYSLTCENHRIIIHGIEFADERETDDYEYLNLDESLGILNMLEANQSVEQPINGDFSIIPRWFKLGNGAYTHV